MASSRKQSEMEKFVFFLLCLVFLPILLPLACIALFLGWTKAKNAK